MGNLQNRDKPKTKKQLRQEAIEKSKRRDDEDRLDEAIIPDPDPMDVRNILDCVPGMLM